jgi:DNA-directed RNA polymerase specialized sigma24 family protein
VHDVPKRAFKKSPWIKLRTVKQLQSAADREPAIVKRFDKLTGGLAEHVRRMLATLTPREREVLKLRFKE